MDQITPQQIRDRFRTLPETLRATIADPSTFEKIEKIGTLQGLTKVETGLLAQTTSMLMMGFIEPGKYVGALMDQLTISQEQAAMIAQEINRDIFNPIKDELKKLHGVELTAPSKPSAPIIPVVPQKNISPSLSGAQSTPSLPVAPPTPAKMVSQPTTSSASLSPASVKAPQPPAPTLPIPPLPIAPKAEVRQEMRTITMDPQKLPIAPKPAVTPSSQVPASTVPSMNIFEEKLGTTFRMKSEASTASPIPPSMPTMLSTPPVSQVVKAAQNPVRPPVTTPVIGVVPLPTPPVRPPLSPMPTQKTAPAPQMPATPAAPKPALPSDPYREAV